MRLNFFLELIRLSLLFSFLIKFRICKILLFRLFEASELLKMKANKSVLRIGLFIRKNKYNLSISHPDKPLKDITTNVIIKPPIYNFDLFSFAILSVNPFEKLITTPINWTGCGKSFGSPIKRSRTTATKIK